MLQRLPAVVAPTDTPCQGPRHMVARLPECPGPHRPMRYSFSLVPSWLIPNLCGWIAIASDMIGVKRLNFARISPCAARILFCSQLVALRGCFFRLGFLHRCQCVFSLNYGFLFGWFFVCLSPPAGNLVGFLFLYLLRSLHEGGSCICPVGARRHSVHGCAGAIGGSGGGGASSVVWMALAWV